MENSENKLPQLPGTRKQIFFRKDDDSDRETIFKTSIPVE